MHRNLRSSALALGGLTTLGAVAAAPSSAAAPATAASVEAADPSAAPRSAERRFEVRTRRPGTAPGLLFTTPQNPQEPEAAHGPEILDDRGRPVWSRPVPTGQWATDLRVQRYRGRPVLTWWQGTLRDRSNGEGVGYIADENYRIIATVRGHAAQADLHEFRLTSRGTALITVYRYVKQDLSPVGGPADGTVMDGVVEEIDIATGKVLLSWSSLEHVPVTESEMPPVMARNGPYDYFHINSVDEDTDGGLLISARHTSTVLKIDRTSGKIIWRLGGRRSSFPLGVGVRFSWQHDATSAGRNLVKVFDNVANDVSEGYESRVVWIRIDPRRGTSEFVRQITHPEHLSVTREGGAQELPNGNTIVTWGPTGRISEFDRRGRLLFDAALQEDWSSYRVYRFPWKGRPEGPPAASVADGVVHAVWNGATGVARWRVLGGPAEDELKPLAHADWNGLDTAVPLPGDAASARYVKVEALDEAGAVLGTSPVVPAGK